MKKLTILLVAVLLLSCIGCLIACQDETPLVSSVKIDVSLNYSNGQTVLSWNTVEGVDYSVYRAPSRYAEFEFVQDCNGTFADNTRYAYYKIYARDKAGNLIKMSDPVSEEYSIFEDNAYVFAPTDDMTRVSRILSDIYSEMERSHFTNTRYAVFFKPGDYGDLTVNVPFFTTFAGLGEQPDDVTLSSLNCDGKWNGNALVNFWRGVENLSFSNTSRWSVSQGTFMRSVNITGDLYLFDWDNYRPGQTGGNEASGGFIADSRITGKVNSGSQQQWFTRNSQLSSWSGCVWNMVFAGVNNAPAGTMFTSVANLPVLREKPRLVFGQDGYSILVPALRQNASDCDATEGSKSAIDNIYFANASRDTATTINAQLSSGKSIVFMPGVYRLSQPIKVNNSGAVLLGTGLATLIPTAGNSCIEVGDVDGVTVGGLLFDAGTKQSDTLLKVGESGGNHSSNPIFLFDCFFRVGGNSSQNSYATTSLQINANDTVVDNCWLWRADHGSGVGWDKNNGDYGAVIVGDRVKCYGLFAEHYKKHNVSWSGNDGYLVFYQSELAYDVPSNEAWRSDDGNGYASLRVHDNVTKFESYGLGIYSNFETDGIVLDCAMRVPAQGNIYVGYLCSYAMSLKGTVNNLINEDGLYINSAQRFRSVRNYGTK